MRRKPLYTTRHLSMVEWHREDCGLIRSGLMFPVRTRIGQDDGCDEEQSPLLIIQRHQG